MKWILAHADCDGICSCAIAFSIFKNANIFFSHPVGLASDLKQVDGDLLVLDIALSSRELDSILKELKRIHENGYKIIYIDHHPLPKNFNSNLFYGELIHSLSSSTSELTFMKFKNYLSMEMGRIAIYGAIGDYLDNTPGIEKLLEYWDKRTLYFESGLLIEAIESMGRDYNMKRELVKYLSENKLPSDNDEIVKMAIKEASKEEEMRKIIEKEVKTIGKIAYLLDIKWSLGKSAIYARAITNSIVGIGAETRKNFIDMSLRTPFDHIRLNEIVMEIAEKLGGSGGGHRKAVGARIPKEYFYEFLTKLNEKILNIEKE
ncbi:MAG: DHHA1 domain-containing protein [Candidatus Verstraetearchaeota archaeon]|nr:DHHA1 domain-containing protein [Candidatus Verstraetearchaeota archaeon]